MSNTNVYNNKALKHIRNSVILTKPGLRDNILSSMLDLGLMRSNTTEIKATIAAKFMFSIIINITSRALDF
jgi:hypothetical protein